MKGNPLQIAEERDQWLALRLASELQRQPHAAPEALLSITLELGERPCPRPATLVQGDFYWASPQRRLTLWGRGAPVWRRATGDRRLDGLSRQLRAAAGGWSHRDPDATGLEPLLFVALAFDGRDPMQDDWAAFPNSALFLPELLLHREGARARLVFSTHGIPVDGWDRQIRRWLQLAEPLLHPRPQPAGASLGPAPRPAPAEPDDPAWLALAGRALAGIDAGALQKLVLYRRRRLALPHAPHLGTLLTLLAQDYPDCRLFATVQGDRTLVSASPERLLSKRGRRLASDALAGTLPRAPDPRQDAALARTLRHDPKIRHEQALVAEAVRSALGPLCEGLDGGRGPDVRRLPNVQHLWNEFRGQLRGDQDLLQVAARLHPTPAVNGSPGPAALDWLRRHDQSRRGWYCGAGGWVDRRGDGELAVLLRCALLQGRRAELFAGAGLVTGSDPRAELAETELKTGAMLHALARA